MKHRFATTMALLAPFAAFAQEQEASPGFFKPPADDTSVGILREIFGSIVDTVMANADSGGAPETALAAAMQVFGSGVLALGMLFVLFTTVKGAVDTAHDGEFLGKKLSSVWVPLRTAAGTALLLPLKSGFSLMQIGVLWIAIHGVGLADRMWSGAIAHMESTGMVGRPSIPSARVLAASILRSEVCMHAMNKTWEASGDPRRVALQAKDGAVYNFGSALPNPLGSVHEISSTVVNMRLKTVEWTWAATGPSGYINPDICGGLHWEQSDESVEGNADATLDKGAMTRAQAAAIEQMIVRMRIVARQIVAGNTPPEGELEKAATAYEDAVARAANSLVQQANNKRNSAFLAFAENGGWLYAGTYYNHIIAMNDAVQRAINAAPSARDATVFDKEVEENLINYRDAMTATLEYIRNGSKSASRFYKSNGGSDVRNIDEPRVDDITSLNSWDALKERVLNQPVLWAIRQMTEEIGGSNLSHMAQMKNVGDIIMNTAWTVYGLVIVAKGAAGANVAELTIGNLFSLKDALDGAQGVLSLIVMGLLAGGAYLAFYLPMIPYITWITGIIKWLIVVIESVIAAPIWAAAHIHPDGDEQVGRAGPGYMIILSVFLRPALMLFGFILAIVASQPIAHFVNYTYMTQVQGAMGSSLNGVGALLAYTFIYALVMTILLHSVFSLINWLPDNVLRFIGNAVGSHGIADREGHDVDSKFGAIVHTTTHGLKPGGTKGHGGPAAPGKKPAGGGVDAHSTADGGGGANAGRGSPAARMDQLSTSAPTDDSPNSSDT